MARLKMTSDPPSWGPVLQSGRFAEVCDSLEKLGARNHQHTYVLGYAYWRLGQPYKTIAHWWKLAHKVEKTLLDDLHVLSEQTADAAVPPNWEAFSLSELKSQFLCLRRLVPEASVTYQLRELLYQKLWHTGAFQELKRFTQKDPGLTSGERLVWLAKLLFRDCSGARRLPLSWIDIYISGVATFLKQQNSPIDETVIASFLAEFQECLRHYQRRLDQANIEALLSYAQHGFTTLSQLLRYPAIQATEMLLTPAFLQQWDPHDPMRRRYLDILRSADLDSALLKQYEIPSIWGCMKPNTLDHAVTRTAFMSVQGRPDPFQTLGVRPGCSKSEVMAAMMKLIREQPQNMAEFRRAQNEIFDPDRVLRLLFFNHPPRQRECSEISNNSRTSPEPKPVIALPYRGPKEFAPYA